MTNPTSNFGWQMPTSTDLVTDLPADFEVFGQAVDTSLADLKGGTTNQVLAKNSNTDMDFKWVADAAGMTNPMTTTGDTIYSSPGSTPVRLGIGSTGNVLTVAGGVPTWAAPASGTTFSGASVYKSAAQGTSTASQTKITFDLEEYDTDSYHSTVTNTERFTIPSGKTGYYQFNLFVSWAQNSTGNYRIVSLYKNNVQFKANTMLPNNAPQFKVLLTVTVYATAGDYFECVAYQDSGGSLNVLDNDQNTWFQITYLGA
jgi:hypothetical protein